MPTEIPTPCGPSDAIERTGDLLAGGGLDSHRVLVSLNAAHLLLISGIVPSQREGMALAEDIMRSGAALVNVAGAGLAPRSA